MTKNRKISKLGFAQSEDIYKFRFVITAARALVMLLLAVTFIPSYGIAESAKSSAQKLVAGLPDWCEASSADCNSKLPICPATVNSPYTDSSLICPYGYNPASASTAPVQPSVSNTVLCSSTDTYSSSTSAQSVSIQYYSTSQGWNQKTWDFIRSDATGKNPVPWVPKGVVVEGFLRPFVLNFPFAFPWGPSYQSAYNRWGGANSDVPTDTLPSSGASAGCTELKAIQAYGADTVRFQVSQEALAAVKNKSAATIASAYYPTWQSCLHVDPLSKTCKKIVCSPTAGTANSTSSDSTKSGSAQFGMMTQCINNYAQTVVDAVVRARALGLNVIVAMNPASTYSYQTYPTVDTKTAWQLIDGVFAQDTGVMYELFNEPNYPSFPLATKTPGGTDYIWDDWQKPMWAAWANSVDWSSMAGSNISQGVWYWNQSSLINVPSVGHQDLVKMIRADGARNVLIIDGIQGAQIDDWTSTKDWTANKRSTSTQAGASASTYFEKAEPEIDDYDSTGTYAVQSSQIAYAIHPYPNQSVRGQNAVNSTLWNWESTFGNFALNHPVIATEWNSSSDTSCRGKLAGFSNEGSAAAGTDNADSPEIAYDFLNYAQFKEIGIVGWSFDWDNELVNWSSSQLAGSGSSITATNYTSLTCGSANANGGGAYLQALWAGKLTPPDNTSPIDLIGVCGSAAGTPASSAPAKALCAYGDSSAVTSSGTSNIWMWSCAGRATNGGNNNKKISDNITVKSCSAPVLVIVPSCGVASGQAYTNMPTTGLCGAGAASVLVKSTDGYSWSWSCQGTSGTTAAVCSAGRASCGAANAASYTSTPATTSLCRNGTYTNFVQNSDQSWSWNCTGQDAATVSKPITCMANAAGVCGSANNVTSLTAPAANLCAFGISSNPSLDNYTNWNWTCSGSKWGKTAACWARGH